MAQHSQEEPRPLRVGSQPRLAWHWASASAKLRRLQELSRQSASSFAVMVSPTPMFSAALAQRRTPLVTPIRATDQPSSRLVRGSPLHASENSRSASCSVNANASSGLQRPSRARVMTGRSPFPVSNGSVPSRVEPDLAEKLVDLVLLRNIPRKSTAQI